jgi:hypothetical protein
VSYVFRRTSSVVLHTLYAIRLPWSNSYTFAYTYRHADFRASDLYFCIFSRPGYLLSLMCYLISDMCHLFSVIFCFFWVCCLRRCPPLSYRIVVIVGIVVIVVYLFWCISVVSCCAGVLVCWCAGIVVIVVIVVFCSSVLVYVCRVV